MGLALKLGCSELDGGELKSGGTLKGVALEYSQAPPTKQRKDLISSLVWVLGWSLGLKEFPQLLLGTEVSSTDSLPTPRPVKLLSLLGSNEEELGCGVELGRLEGACMCSLCV